MLKEKVRMLTVLVLLLPQSYVDEIMFNVAFFFFFNVAKTLLMSMMLFPVVEFLLCNQHKNFACEGAEESIILRNCHSNHLHWRDDRNIHTSSSLLPW